MNLRLKSVTEDQLEGADCILYIIDTTRIPGDEEKMNASLAEKYSDRMIIALNKTDAKESKTKPVMDFIKTNLPKVPEDRILEMSAQKDIGINEVLRALYNIAPEAPRLYIDDIYTDQNIEFRIAEVIRGEAINRLAQEIPHCLYVQIADLEGRNEGKKLWVRAFLCVERDSQKGIVIGKGATMIKSIRAAALKQINMIFPFKVELDLQVKVDKNWRQHDHVLTKIIP
jgi:GTP-binding protein Era